MTTKEDKKIISTLALINNNRNKLTLYETLNKSIKKIEADPLLQDLVNDLRSVSDGIKRSNVLTNKHLIKVSPDANKIEEVHARNTKHDNKENVDVAYILYDMNKILFSEEKNSMRFDLSSVEAHTKRYKHCDILSFLDVPKSKNSLVHDSVETHKVF